ncbi:MAG TPA: response regulator [Candidatus Omnitrophota bacterium]|nr:response regulator [Candidatus Omnitrophota bacterium]HRY85458.1 response regulator [Candidatus Omnitrophota bacterium]
MSKKILIIEDDSDFQDIYSLYLQGESYQVLTANNGKEGLAVLEKETPDLIILDLIMPVMDGEEFYVRLRANKKWQKIPVIIASVNEKIPLRVEELGGVAFHLKKPFETDLLLQKIRDNLK